LGLAGASSAAPLLRGAWRGEQRTNRSLLRETAWLSAFAALGAILGAAALVVGTDSHPGWSPTRVFSRVHELDPTDLHGLLLKAPWVALGLAAACLVAGALSRRPLGPLLGLLLLAVALPAIARHAAGINSLHLLCRGRVEHLDWLLSCLGLPALPLPGAMMVSWVRREAPPADSLLLHASRANLFLHLLAVPLFGFGWSRMAWVPLVEGGKAWVSGSAMVLVALALQGLGHRFEGRSPELFQGSIDPVRRIVVEQFATYPRFLLGGHAWRAWQAASAAFVPTRA
jgi:hypothetical protein